MNVEITSGGIVMSIKDAKDLGAAINSGEDTIEIEGDVANKVIKIKATGKVVIHHPLLVAFTNTISLLFVIFIFLYFNTGVFVIQPFIGQSKGETVVYLRGRGEIPFLTCCNDLFSSEISNEELLAKINTHKLVSLPYYNILYKLSSNVINYELEYELEKKKFLFNFILFFRGIL